ELDSVPGGIGLTAWLNQAYSSAPGAKVSEIVGGADEMLKGFAGILGEAKQVQIIVSEEAATYRPEMEWIAKQLGSRFAVQGPDFEKSASGEIGRASCRESV